MRKYFKFENQFAGEAVAEVGVLCGLLIDARARSKPSTHFLLFDVVSL